MSLGRKIKDLRLGRGLTQAELAERMGVHTLTLALFEQDRRMPGTERLAWLAEFFGVSMDELMCSDRTVHRWFGSSGELPTVKNILMFSIAFCLSIDVCLALLKSLHCSLWPEDVRYVELLLRNYPGQAVESLPLVDCMCLKMPRFR